MVHWIGIASAMAWSPSAYAQTAGDAAAAQDLFDRARKLVAQGNHAEACPKFAESQRLDPEPGTEFNLADCYEHVGKTASAWVAFADVADRLRVTSDKARANVALARAAALQPKLARLTINAPGDSRVSGLTIKRDGEVVRDAQWGIGVPVDPGTHAVEASAPDMQTWTSSVEVKGEGKTVSVDVPKLAPVPPTPTSVPASAPVQDTGATAESPPRAETHGSTQRTLSYVAGAAGIGAIGIGTYFGLATLSKNNASRSDCTGNQCGQQGFDDRKSALSDGNAATIAYGVGLAALVGGVVLYLTAPTVTGGPTTGGPVALTPQRLQWNAAITPAGVVIDGSF
jgi:hypothetical protein